MASLTAHAADFATPRPTGTTAPAPRPVPPGPVLIGDIHGAFGGTPVLLHLWRHWKAHRDADRGASDPS